MLRKFAILAVSVSALAGLSMAADDEESPFQTQMSEINKKHTALRKATRTDAAFAKAGDSISKDAQAVAKIGKEYREHKEFSDKEKKPLAEWTKLMDEMVKASEDLSAAASKPQATHAQAKEAFTAYNKTCANCHNVFKKEE